MRHEYEIGRIELQCGGASVRGIQGQLESIDTSVAFLRAMPQLLEPGLYSTLLVSRPFRDVHSWLCLYSIPAYPG